MGSWEREVFGQGQTMSGWNTPSNSSATWVSQALVSLFTISVTSVVVHDPSRPACPQSAVGILRGLDASVTRT